jgi:hypothetical protein
VRHELSDPGRRQTPYVVRICLGTESRVGRLEDALRRLAGMLKQARQDIFGRYLMSFTEEIITSDEPAFAEAASL